MRWPHSRRWWRGGITLILTDVPADLLLRLACGGRDKQVDAVQRRRRPTMRCGSRIVAPM